MDINHLDHQSPSQLFEVLLDVMSKLRGPGGCPWDRKQTHQSLASCLLEESYETLAAIDQNDTKNLCEELGDLLLQVIFHSQIAQEGKKFSIHQVLIQIIQKLVRRHPHVFATERVDDAEEAIQNWERIKASEKKSGESILSGVPVQLPALARAYRLGTKASRLGFDWKDAEGVFEKIEEEIQELREAYQSKDMENLEEEFGDLLFSLAQAARFLKLNPEDALRKSAHKFQRRFEWMEAKVRSDQQELHQLNSTLLEEYWNQAKLFTESVKKL